MSVVWSNLPLLPLGCILEHLSLEDALAAMSTCRNWRNVIMYYHGHKDTLKLTARNIEKSAFLTRIFKRHIKNLHIYVDCGQAEFDAFINIILPEFFDSLNLEELVIMGPGYVQQSQHAPIIKVKRIPLESLVLKHMRTLRKLALMGCHMDKVKNENDRFIHKTVSFHSSPLTYNTPLTPADAVLSRCNINMMMFSSLQHISVEYSVASASALETLSQLTHLSRLTLHIGGRRQPALAPVDWRRVNACYATPPEVALNIVGLSMKRLDDVMEKVLVQGLTLTSLKVMFCKTMYAPLVKHAAAMYKNSLRELVWADCPLDSPDPTGRYVKLPKRAEYDACNVNPFIFLCWQCQHLRRLVVHGYWIWEYDAEGMVRLRRSLERVSLSALYRPQGMFSPAPLAPLAPSAPDAVCRVLTGDAERPTSAPFVKSISKLLNRAWAPTRWSELPPGLRARSTPAERAAYVVAEANGEYGPDRGVSLLLQMAADSLLTHMLTMGTLSAGFKSAENIIPTSR